MQNVYGKVMFLTLAFAGIIGSTFQIQAQEIQTLLDWDSNWRYAQDGTDLGTAWREFSYPEENEAPWSLPTPGIVAFEDAPIPYAVHAPLNNVLTISLSVTTFYFRATFNFSGPTTGLMLVATNFIDDGAVIYLNGTEVGRVRVPLNQRAATFASAGPTTEGTMEPLVITNLALLRQGQNVLAVEVHQIATNSTDLVWGTKLLAIRPTPLTITSQPQRQVVIVGRPLTLSVGISGGPASYRWFKVGSTTVQSSSPTYSVSSAQVVNSGDYYVVVTNSLSVLTSQVATVSVLVDTVGPVPIDARGDTNTYANRGAQAIAIRFPTTDALLANVSTNPANFAVYAGTDFSTRVTFTNVTYASTPSPRLFLWMSDPGWTLGNNYFVVLNNIADARGNLIAPNTRVPVSWEVVTNLVQTSDSWDFYDQGDASPEVYTATPAWNATNYVKSPLWQTGNGLFVSDPGVPVTPCAGDSVNSTLDLQSSPILFRRTIFVPPAFASNAVLRLRTSVDDGMLFYLNGREAYAYNARSNRGPVTATTSSVAVTNPVCFTNILLSLPLLPGTNWLAAAVLSGPETPVDIYFGLAVDGLFLKTSSMPADPPANQLVLSMAREADGVRLSWPTAFGGYSLQYKTNLNTSLPWISVSNQANPYNASFGDTRFFRLSKP